MRSEITVLVALLGGAVLSMVAWSVGRRGEAATSRHTAQRGSFALGGAVREWFYWTLSPVERLIVALRIAPETFNALGVLLALGSLAAYATGQLPLGGWLMLASGLADVLDGVAARARQVVSRYGAFLDSTLDRFAETAVYVGLAWFYRTPLAVTIVVVALSGSLLVSYTRARGEGLGVECKKGVMQRAERMLLLGFASLLDPTICSALQRETGSVLLTALALVAVGSTATAIWRTIWIARALR
jgi:CDP-diacylglycerol--glycerol-3-phosphate 3-phosphatidyltransferase